ncbi:hypothetical protein A4X06_0g9163 [Tilletia controversa]|uniref:Integrase catalytic domain-containing protein n=1 Tax=Tilletia controversa TaxID=13291 RepID=A0A8X7SSK0_9BASI|nr:hypothetical protein A4X06_0g9163 [Tilletia controversa]
MEERTGKDKGLEEKKLESPQEDMGRRRSPRLARAVQTSENERPHARFIVHDGFLFERCGPSLDRIKLCVPENKVSTIIHEFHNSPRAGHPSSRQTIDALQETFAFPDLAKRVNQHVRTCFECQTNKSRHHHPYGQLQPIFSPAEVFHTLGIDFVVSLAPSAEGHFDAITVMSDKFSKFALFWPSKTTDSARQTAERFLTHAYPWTGLPRRLISDRDPKFTSEFWRELVRALDIQHSMSTAYHPQTDGQVERLNQQLAALLRHTVALDQHDWPKHLPTAMMAYNRTKHESTGQSPYEIVFGRQPRIFPLNLITQRFSEPAIQDLSDLFALHQDVQTQIDHAQQHQKASYDQRHQDWRPKEGDWVLLSSAHYRAHLDPTQRAKAKLGAKFLGPFKVLREVTAGAYELEVPSWFEHTTSSRYKLWNLFMEMQPPSLLVRSWEPQKKEPTRNDEFKATSLDGLLVSWKGNALTTWSIGRETFDPLGKAINDFQVYSGLDESSKNKSSPSKRSNVSLPQRNSSSNQQRTESKNYDCWRTRRLEASLSSWGAGVRERC